MKLHVQDMTCGHCSGVLTKAVRDVDAQAKVAIDLTTRTVSIESSHPASEFVFAIEAAGYSPALDD